MFVIEDYAHKSNNENKANNTLLGVKHSQFFRLSQTAGLL